MANTARFIGEQPTPKPKEKKSIGNRAINFLTGFANAVSQGVTFGTADEIAGYFAPVFGGDREAVRDAMRDNLEQFREDSPFTAYGTEIAASVATPLGAIKAAPKLAALAGQGLARLNPALATPIGKAAVGGGVYAGSSAEGTLGERLPEALTGGALGAGFQRFSPAITERAKTLLSKGVPLTIGQSLGGATKTIEEAMGSLPFIGDTIRSAQRKSIEAFNPVVINEALESIGEKLPLDKSGTDAYIEAMEKIGNVYKRTIGQIGINYNKSLDEIIAPYADLLTPDTFKELKNIVSQELLPRIKDGKLIGEDFKQAQSALRTIGFKAITDGDYFINNLGKAVNDVVLDITSELSRVKPNVGKQLRNADTAYSKMLPIRTATIKAEETEGVFSPAQLQSAIRSNAKDQPRRLASGQIDLQETARIGRDVLGAKLPDSGTATRGIVSNMILGLGGGTPFAMPIEGAIAGGLLSALYTPLGQQAMKAVVPRTGNVMRSPAVAGLLANEMPMVSEAQAEPMDRDALMQGLLQDNTNTIPRFVVRPEGSAYLPTDY